MKPMNIEDATMNEDIFILNTTAEWNPDDEDPVEGDWDDEDDEDFDDLSGDLDDLHQIELEDEFAEPDPEDDDHFPDDDEEE